MEHAVDALRRARQTRGVANVALYHFDRGDEVRRPAAELPVHLRQQRIVGADLVPVLQQPSARCEPMKPAPPRSK
jgi:hypothetical protein